MVRWVKWFVHVYWGRATGDTGDSEGAMPSGFFFTETEPVTTFSQVMQADADRFNEFFQGMLSQGINLAPSPFECGFVSAAHGDTEIDTTLEAAEFTFAKMRN